MVDSVNIVGIDGEALGSALREAAPPWATEQTLNEIKSLLKSANNKGAGGGGTGSGKDSESILKKYINLLDKRSKKEEEEFKKKQKRSEEEADKHALFGKGLTTLNQKILFAAAALHKFGDIINDTYKKNFDTFTSLSQGGISLTAGLDGATEGFEALKQITALTGVRFTELSGIMSKYSVAVNAFTAGKFAKTVGKASAELTEFGYSSKESAELLGAYLESQRGYTNANNRTVEETTIGLVKFGQKITNLSMITGMSRSAILANIDAITKSTDQLILSVQKGEQAAGATSTFLASFKDQNFAKTLLRMMTDPIKTMNSTYMSLQKIGLGGLSEKLNSLAQSLVGKSEEEQARITAAFADRYENELKLGAKQAAVFRQVEGYSGQADAALQAINGALQTSRQFRDESAKEKNDPSIKARARLASQWEALMSKLQANLSAPMSVINALANGLEWLNNAINSVTETLGPATTNWVGFVGLMASAAGSLILGLRGITSVFNLFGKSLPTILTNPLKMLGNGIKHLYSGMSWLVKGMTSLLLKPLSYLGGALVRLAGAAGWLYSAWEVGQWIGGKMYEWMGATKTFTTLMDGIFSGLDQILKFIPGSIGDSARERIKSREAVEAANKAQNVKQKTAASIAEKKSDKVIANGNQAPVAKEISVPKNPTPSTIESPSAKPATEVEKAVTSAPDAPAATESSAPALGVPQTGNDINNTLAYQNSILEQMLLSMNNGVSVNQDILKYTKANV